LTPLKDLKLKKDKIKIAGFFNESDYYLVEKIICRKIL